MSCVAVLILVAACGSRQSPSATTVSSGGAHVPEPAVAEASPTVEPSIPDGEFVAADVVADEAEAPREERTRRDTKMTSYEEAMARPVDIGDASTEGGEAQLSGEQIARVMDAHLDEMYDECIEKELRRGNDLGTVTIDLAIRGRDGMILGTTIEPGRRRFTSCLETYLQDVSFPTFASPRMGARYRFHAG